MVPWCQGASGLSPDIYYVVFPAQPTKYDKLKLTTIMASTAASSSTATAASAADTVYYTVNTKDVEAPKTPFLHEIWNYEGDLTILPRKFSSCVQAAFGDHGEHSIAPPPLVFVEFTTPSTRFATGAHFTSEYFTKTFVEAKQFDPAGVFFITSRCVTNIASADTNSNQCFALRSPHRSDCAGVALAWTDSSDSKIGRLHWLAVHPKHRRKGVGRALVQYMFDGVGVTIADTYLLLLLSQVRLVAQYHNKKGRATMYLKTEADRDAAIKLYESEGETYSYNGSAMPHISHDACLSHQASFYPPPSQLMHRPSSCSGFRWMVCSFQR